MASVCKQFAGEAGCERYVVFADSILKPIMPTYIDTKRADIEFMLRAIEDNSWETVEWLADHMKGDGGCYGFDYISTVGNYIERAAFSRDGAEVNYFLENLRAYLDRIEIVYINPDEGF